MNALAALVCLSIAGSDAAAILRARAAKELEKDRLECAQVLASIARTLAPGTETDALEAEAARRLRAATVLERGPLDLSAIADSPYEGVVVRGEGIRAAQRTGKRSSLKLVIDGEQVLIKGRMVSRKRLEPGEFESDRLVIVGDDETLLVEKRALSIVPREPPGALAGKLLASEDERERAAGALLDSVRATIRAFERLNDQRLAAGVAPVAYSAELSRGCFLHARYLAETDAARVAGSGTHEEVESSPWYTPEGAAAGRRSCVAYVGVDLAIDQSLATLYHRLPLLEPGLARIGIAHAEKDRRYATVIEVQSALEPSSAVGVRVPGPDQKGVPIRFASGEWPDPRPPGTVDVAGYPITLSSYGGAEPTSARLTARGREVECFVSTPRKPANALRADNLASICLIPKAPLERATKHTVSIVAEGKAWEWSFTTR